MAENKVLRLQIRDGRLAFPNLSKPGKFGYGARLIIPPDHTQILNVRSRAYLADLGVKVPADPKARIKTIPLLKQVALAIAKRKWSEKAPTVVASLEAQDRLFYHNGNTKAELEGFEGNFFIACGSKGPVTMFLQDRSEATEKEIWSGCYVNGLIDVWAQDNADGGKRLNASIYGVQKVRDGDAFAAGGTPAESDEFDDISDEEGTEAGADEDETDLTA